MTDEEINAVIKKVTPEAKVRVWYYHLSQFEINEGFFSHDGYTLQGVEVDAVCKNQPIDLEAEDDAHGYSFSAEHRGHTVEYNTTCRGGVYAIEILEPGIDTIIRMDIAGMSIVADMRAKTMTIDDAYLDDAAAAQLSKVCLKWLKGVS